MSPPWPPPVASGVCPGPAPLSASASPPPTPEFGDPPVWVTAPVTWARAGARWVRGRGGAGRLRSSLRTGPVPVPVPVAGPVPVPVAVPASAQRALTHFLSGGLCTPCPAAVAASPASRPARSAGCRHPFISYDSPTAFKTAGVLDAPGRTHFEYVFCFLLEPRVTNTISFL